MSCTRAQASNRVPNHQEPDRREAEREPAYVCEEGNTAAARRMHERVVRSAQLEVEPEPDEEGRRDAQEDERERPHAGEREDHQVAAEHRGYGAARADVRD